MHKSGICRTGKPGEGDQRGGVSEAVIEDLLARLRSTPGFSELTPRAQAKLYAAEIGKGKLANLLQLARLGKLDLEMGRKILKDPGEIQKLSPMVS